MDLTYISDVKKDYSQLLSDDEDSQLQLKSKKTKDFEQTVE